MGWRSAVRSLLGDDLEKVWKSLACLATGQPLICNHPDGRQLAIVPTAADVVRAGTELAHMIYGRPVDQTEIVKAEIAASAQEEVRRLSDADLKARVLTRLGEYANSGTGLAGGDAISVPALTPRKG